MTRLESVETYEVEAWLVNKIRSKGLIHLSLEEVETAYRSKSFADVYRKCTGHSLPDNLRSQMAERLNHCGRLKNETFTGAESKHVCTGREVFGSSFLRAVANGDMKVVLQGLMSADRLRLKDVVDEKHRTCLHLAALAGHVEILRLLHDHGADVEARDRFNRTPLHFASEYGRKEATEVLLSYDCQVGVKDASGRTALHLAACCEEPQVSMLLAACQPELLARLDQHLRTPLFYAVLNLHPHAMIEITRQLLELQAEANARDSNGMVPLHYAAEAGKKTAVMLLLQHHADPTIEDSINGRTPIQLSLKHEGVRRELQKVLDSRGHSTPMKQGKNPHQERSPSKADPVGWGKPFRPPNLQAPLALGAPFQVLQERFVKIMERIQQGGMEQMEHIKRPHLFTGSWMADVSTHQQLLGQALKYVPGPEVCIRIFNLLRPPSKFPVSCGDERDIIAFYEGEQGGSMRPSWGGPDPYATAAQYHDDADDLSQARRVELLRAIHDQKRELDAKSMQLEEFRRKIEGLQADMRERGEPGELQVLRDEAERAKRQHAAQTEDLEIVESRVSMLQGQNRVLQEQLAGEKQRYADLLVEQSNTKSKLQALEQRRGENQAWQEQFELEKRQSDTVKRRLEDQLNELQNSKVALEVSETSLRAEVRKLQAELSASVTNAGAEAEAARYRGKADELALQVTNLTRELEQVQTNATRHVKMSKEELFQQTKLRESTEEDLRQLRADVKELPILREEVTKLKQEKDNLDKYWRRMFSEYHLIGQAFFGGS